MLTVLEVLAVLAVLFVAAAVATQEGDVLVDVAPDRADLGLPLAPLEPEDVAGVRFAMAIRGYRMSEVDAVLARLADELAARDVRLRALESALVREAEALLERADGSAAPEEPTSEATASEATASEATASEAPPTEEPPTLWPQPELEAEPESLPLPFGSAEEAVVEASDPVAEPEPAPEPEPVPESQLATAPDALVPDVEQRTAPAPAWSWQPAAASEPSASVPVDDTDHGNDFPEIAQAEPAGAELPDAVETPSEPPTEPPVALSSEPPAEPQTEPPTEPPVEPSVDDSPPRAEHPHGA